MVATGLAPTRVLDVESDPALRGILSHALSRHPDIEIHGSVGGGAAALEAAMQQHFDVAFVDLALGSGAIGFVIYSKHSASDFTADPPEQMRWGLFSSSNGLMSVLICLSRS